MSDSAYRGAGEAARARVTALEAELRKRKGLAAKLAALSAPHDDEKKKIRERMARNRNSRIIGMVASLLVFPAFLLLMRAMASFDFGAAVVFVAFSFMVAWLRFAVQLRFPTRAERDGEAWIREIAQQDQHDAQRFRVASSQLRVQAHLEAADLEALERELDEAREIAALEEKKS